jgi:hypothetical protein
MHDLIAIVVAYVTANAVSFCMDKEVRIGDWFLYTFTPEYEKYESKYSIWFNKSTRTPVASDNLRDAEKIIIPLFRQLYSLLRGNPLVRNSDLDAMHLPQRPDNEHKPSPVADEAPAFHIVAVEGNRLRIFYYPEGSTKKVGKPEGQHGVEIKWGFSDEVITDAELLPHSLFDTASPYTLEFNPSDYGKVVNIAMRWENNRGAKGPWSKVIRANVP